MHGKLLNVVRATVFGFNELHKGDRVCVRAFSGGGSTEILPFTEDLQAVYQAILIQVLKLPFAGDPRLEPAAGEAAIRFRREPRTHRKRAVLIVTDKPGSPGPNEMGVARDLWNSDAVLSELIIDRPQQTKVLKTGENGIVDRDRWRDNRGRESGRCVSRFGPLCSQRLHDVLRFARRRARARSESYKWN